MIVEEMSERDCLAMLDRTEIAYLACAKDNQPYVVPIRIDFEGGFVYAYSMEGQKIEFMRQNPLVCLMINDVTSRRRWSSVVVYGRYEELPNACDYHDSGRSPNACFKGMRCGGSQRRRRSLPTPRSRRSYFASISTGSPAGVRRPQPNNELPIPAPFRRRAASAPVCCAA